MVVLTSWDRNIDRPPSEYLKDFYYDSVNFDVNALSMAIAFAGVDHIVAGSDYPHQIGSLELMKQSIASLHISEAEKDKIRAGNTTKILRLCQNGEIPPTEVGWMVQIQPTAASFRNLRIPPTSVGGILDLSSGFFIVGRI